MSEGRSSIPILTYHSVSDEPGPTSIPASVFRAQMDAVRELDVDVVDLEWVLTWMSGEVVPARRTIAITFDDAFQDFADAAYPILANLGLAASVFAPTGLVGERESWPGANDPPRQLMDWPTIRSLSAAGVRFGSHARTHCDLTRLDDQSLDRELLLSRRELEDQLGSPSPFFAPPYGRSSSAVRRAVARRYSMSFGVRLGEATALSPLFDMPRIEMHYFRDITRWRAFLKGEGRLYFRARRLARGVREAARIVGERVAG